MNWVASSFFVMLIAVTGLGQPGEIDRGSDAFARTAVAKLTGDQATFYFDRVRSLTSGEERARLERVTVSAPDTDYWVTVGPHANKNQRKIVMPVGYAAHLRLFCTALVMERLGCRDISIAYFEYIEDVKGLDRPVVGIEDFARATRGWSDSDSLRLSSAENQEQIGTFFDHAMLFVVAHEAAHFAEDNFEMNPESEREADEWAVRLLLNAGVPPYGGVIASLHLHRLERSRVPYRPHNGRTPTHPPSLERAIHAMESVIDATREGGIEWERAGISRSEAERLAREGLGLLRTAQQEQQESSDFEFFEGVAERSPKAAYVCFQMLRDGTGGADADEELAMRYLVSSARRGFHWALCEAGYRHETGQGLPKDLDLARSAYQRAAGLGSIYARNRLRALSE